MGKHGIKVPFSISGRFLTYKVTGTFKIKGIYLATAQGEVYVKLPKSLRYTSMQMLESGAWVCVKGHQKIKHGKRKLKALSIVRTNPCTDEETMSKSKGSVKQIKVCQKSSCRKRGSKAICKALNKSLKQTGLKKKVALQDVGCMGKCKAGPNISILPDKTRYTHVRPKQVAGIIQQHFC
ncbi:Ferredoxin, 2Fe-2s [Acaryochloris thomasi RCC1774]|uniref:Ferredoxin, 2Fe-2s n=1 Tax=Acaryochloris thomasi RCC1774 TaxID=1764569 RepID=A0A2W1JHQ3_9CYAN|nr:(2Fe-2S) ferredoxin domain-containing protein [Acaryochloris thomasi]PZD73080.1 Ferredoxin, 2Fe-2s [Acaryochloris thomasi RCC1774]